MVIGYASTLLPSSLSNVVLVSEKLNTFNFDHIYLILKFMVHISIIRYIVEFIFTINLFRVIHVANVLYKYSQT